MVSASIMEIIKEIKSLLTHQNSQQVLSDSHSNREGTFPFQLTKVNKVSVKVQKGQSNLDPKNF